MRNASRAEAGTRQQSLNPWKFVAWTSLAWMAVLGIKVVGFLGALKRQDRKLDLLPERGNQISQPGPCLIRAGKPRCTQIYSLNA